MSKCKEGEEKILSPLPPQIDLLRDPSRCSHSMNATLNAVSDCISSRLLPKNLLLLYVAVSFSSSCSERMRSTYSPAASSGGRIAS